jgi:hypothetical protein
MTTEIEQLRLRYRHTWLPRNAGVPVFVEQVDWWSDDNGEEQEIRVYGRTRANARRWYPLDEMNWHPFKGVRGSVLYLPQLKNVVVWDRLRWRQTKRGVCDSTIEWIAGARPMGEDWWFYFTGAMHSSMYFDSSTAARMMEEDSDVQAVALSHSAWMDREGEVYYHDRLLGKLEEAAQLPIWNIITKEWAL